MLGISYKLNIIIFNIMFSFIQPLFIISNKVLNPFPFITTTHTIRRIAEDDHHGGVAFYLVCLFGLVGKPC